MREVSLISPSEVTLKEFNFLKYVPILPPAPNFTPEWGDIPRHVPGSIHPRAKPVALCCGLEKECRRRYWARSSLLRLFLFSVST
ncbi:MAG: hypothetical protein A2162_03675 [Deltaproteobacteria bacterium RBG_13_52_11b]|nr:MAG: hypothetical protein A2162_03675 [Deltaproteobacteria bacterium RBG_13_52_11b]